MFWRSAGEHEQLATSVTPNPTLRNLLDVLTELQADPQARVSADDFPMELISASLSQEAKAAADKELLRRFPTLKVQYAKCSIPSCWTKHCSCIQNGSKLAHTDRFPF